MSSLTFFEDNEAGFEGDEAVVSSHSSDNETFLLLVSLTLYLQVWPRVKSMIA